MSRTKKIMVRCSKEKCKKRRILLKHPDSYKRIPKCTGCGGTKYRVCTWERERNRKNTCYCDGYHYPHMIGVGDCIHSLTYQERMEKRYEPRD